MDSYQNLPKMPSTKTAYLFLGLSAVIGALSGILGRLQPADLIATVMGAVALLSIRRPSVGRMILFAAATGGISLIFSLLVSYIIIGSCSPTCLCSLTYILCALAVSLSVFRLKGRSFTVLLTGVLLSVALVFSLLAAVYDAYGSLSADVFSDLNAQITESFQSAFHEVLDEASESFSLSANDIDAAAKETLQTIKLIAPAILFDVMLLCAYIITGLFRRIMLGYYFGRRNLSGWLVTVSRTTAIVYLIMLAFYMVLSMISAFSDTRTVLILSYATSDLLLLTLPGCFVIGLRGMVASLRMRRGQAILSLGFIILIGCCNPLFLLYYIAFSGAFSVVFTPYIQKKFHHPQQ